MDPWKEKFKNFVQQKKDLQWKKWIDTIHFEISDSKNSLTLYFPHKFTYQLFRDNLQEDFKLFVSTESPNIKKIHYRIRHHNKRSKDNISEEYKYDSRYLLENFLYNEKQKLPYLTCKKITNNEIDEIQQFIIFGDPGVGKTHLLKSILNNFFIQDKKYNILYSKPKLLYSHYTKARSTSLHNIFQNYDIICIDDFHTIINYSYIIQDFSHLLHYLSEKKHKIFIGCNKNSEIYQYIDQRLRSILDSGIHITLNYPDLDVRIRYIDNFCRHRGLALSDGQIVHLARQFNSFRHIRRVLFQVLAAHELQSPHACTDTLLQREVRNVATSGLSVQSVVSELSDYFRIPQEEILSGTKKRKVVRARQIGMALCREMLRLSYPRIGEAFGGRDHSTVMHSIHKLYELLEKDKNLQAMFQSVQQRCEQLRS